MTATEYATAPLSVNVQQVNTTRQSCPATGQRITAADGLYVNDCQTANLQKFLVHQVSGIASAHILPETPKDGHHHAGACFHGGGRRRFKGNFCRPFSRLSKII